MVLSKDTTQGVASAESSPLQPRSQSVVLPLPTPMPGTNIGFSDDDLNGSSSPGKSLPLGEASGYFGFPLPNSSNNAGPHDSIGEGRQRSNTAPFPDFFTCPDNASDVMTVAALNEVEKARLLQSPAHRRPFSEEINHNVLARHSPEAHIASSHGAARDRHNNTEIDASPFDIEHIVFEEYPDHIGIGQKPTPAAQDHALAHVQMDLQKQAHMQLTAKTHAVGNSDSQPAKNVWGTHSSLYDGTGYGTASSSASTPSRSSTAPKASMEVAASGLATPAFLAENSVAMAHEHETLDEVIRAYAAFEEYGASGISEEFLGDVVADAELARKMANYCVGA